MMIDDGENTTPISVQAHMSPQCAWFDVTVNYKNV